MMVAWTQMEVMGRRQVVDVFEGRTACLDVGLVKNKIGRGVGLGREKIGVVLQTCYT